MASTPLASDGIAAPAQTADIGKRHEQHACVCGICNGSCHVFVGAGDNDDVGDERNAAFCEHNKRNVVDKVKKLQMKLVKLQKDYGAEFVLSVLCGNATYSSTSDAAIGLVEDLSLPRALVAKVALADSQRRAAQLLLPQLQAADLPTSCLKQAVTVMFDALLPDRRANMPYHSTPRDHVTQLLPWFPDGVEYEAPSRMNRESLQSLVVAALKHCSAEYPAKFIQALSKLPMEPQHRVRLEYLINLSKPRRNVNTGTPSTFQNDAACWPRVASG
jgi:hypothetical protein